MSNTDPAIGEDRLTQGGERFALRHERFRFLRTVGQGGMGTVYEAIDTADGAHVAVKVLRAARISDLVRFKSEFRTVADLHHPNLVQLFELIQAGGDWLITMELVDGADLSATFGSAAVAMPTLPWNEDAAEEGAEMVDAPAARCDPELARALLAQIVDGLQHLHEHGVVHADLKPSNVLRGVDGRVRLVDFGLATQVLANGAAQSGPSLAGTVPYMAPELLDGGPATPATDLYALGCMAFCLLTGHMPFGPAGVGRALANKRPAPRVEEVVDGVPSDLAALCADLLSTAVDARPGIVEVRARLGLGGSLGTRARPERDVDLIGRSAELRVLAQCFRAAAAGRPQLVMVSGESGIGKSALIEHAVERARDAGFLCLSGRCHERERVPFVAFDRAVDQLAAEINRLPVAEQEAMGEDLQRLSLIFPVLGNVAASATSSPAAGHDNATADVLRLRAFTAFTQIVSRLQARGPLVLSLDDLQWADRDSLELLRHLLQRMSDRVLIIGACRDRTPGDARRLTTDLVEVALGMDDTTLELAPLVASDVAALLQRAGSASASARLVEEAAGNPFLLRLVASGSTAGATSLAHLLDDRISQLSSSAQALLALSAIADDDVAQDVLRDASGLAAGEFRSAMHLLVTERMARITPAADDDPPRAGPYHDRIRAGAEARLSSAQKQLLHRALATAFEQSPHADDAIDQLLRHWSGAGDNEKRGSYLQRAAELAEGRLAFERAARLRQCLLDEGYLSEDALALQRIADLLRSAGRLREAADAYWRSADLWQRHAGTAFERRAGEVRALGQLCETLMRSGHLIEGSAAVARGFKRLELRVGPPIFPHSPTLLRPVARLAAQAVLSWCAEMASWWPWRRPVDDEDRLRLEYLDVVARSILPVESLRAAELWLRVRRLARRCGETAILSRSLSQQAGGLVLFGRPTPRRIDRVLRRVEAIRLPQGESNEVIARQERITRALLTMPANPSLAAVELGRCVEELAGSGLGTTFETERARGMLLVAAFLAGDFDTALAVAREQALSSDAVSRSGGFVVEAVIRLRRGELEQVEVLACALDALQDLQRESRADSMYSAHLRVASAVVRGDFAAALESGRRHEQTAMRVGFYFSDILGSLWVEPLIEASIGLARRGELSRADDLRARRQARRLSRTRNFGFSCRGYRVLALLEEARGHHAQARQHIEIALAESTTAGPYNRWLCLEAARDVGVLTTQQADEAEELVQRGQYRLPQRWRVET